jgi:hypothetical protein
MAAPRHAILFVDHAVERYVKRIAPAMSLTDARRHLETSEFTPTKRRTTTGEHYWLLPDCVAVVKHDHRLRRAVCVTIVPTGWVDSCALKSA